MRGVFAIVFLLLMLLQAIPVLHFFSSHKAVFYTYVDEEKPEQKSKVEKKEHQEYLSVTDKLMPLMESTLPFVFPVTDGRLASPLLEYTTPPPDAC